MAGDIKKAVEFMRMIAKDDSHGYAQDYRNGPDYDCSSLVGTALHMAGFDVSPNSWTGNLVPQLEANGFKKAGSNWIPGDIHITPRRHVAMQVTKTLLAEARINELGRTTGGQAGDQTGREIMERAYYDYPWQSHWRFVPDTAKEPLIYVARRVIRGDFGDGTKRRTLLEQNGYDPDEVQRLVNWLLDPENQGYLFEVARDVIRGKWGNGATRKSRLEAAGYNYDVVQQAVNLLWTATTD